MTAEDARAPLPRRVLCSVLTGACLALATRTPAQAQGTASVHPTTPPVVHAYHLTGPIDIDGKLDESVWQDAEAADHFTQSIPAEGEPAREKTEVRILYDEGAIYVGARMYDSRGAKGVHSRLARRDDMLDLDNGSSQITCDKLILTFDTYHDHRGRAVFEVAPSGVRGDALGEGGSNLDGSWDPIWEARARIDSLGWTAEIRIPLSQLRFARSNQTWGLQIERVIDRLHERDDWAFWHRNESGGASRYGHVEGLELGDPHTARLELYPYALAQGSMVPKESGNPFNETSYGSAQVGGDFRYHVTPNLTLDGTVNPDFGQVEVDPAVVNLSAFETFFPEKRPFFVAGSNAFDFGGFNCYFCSNVSSLSPFYSRRIGRVPQLNDYVTNNALYTDVPDNTTIYGAAKLTGRTSGGYTVGLLDAVTAEEQARVIATGGAPTLSQPTEAFANYFVGRVRKDLSQGATTIGGMVTSSIRSLNDTLLSDSLHTHAEVVGFDFFHAWHRREYSFMGSLALSNVSGSATAIAGTQQTSAHYFQRPDRGPVKDGLFTTRFDSTATSMKGYGGYLRLAKDNGNWLGEVATNFRSPGFEMNDLAFLDRADYVWMSTNIARQWTKPTRHYRNLFLLVGGQAQYNYEGDRNDTQMQANLSIDFPNFWSFQTFALHRPTLYEDRLLRGGPVVQKNSISDYMVYLATDSRRRLVLSVNTEYTVRHDDPAHEVYLSLNALMKPASNVSFSLGPTLDQGRRFLQYVTTQPDPTATLFYGNRYVFAYIDQTTFSMNTRLNVTFTPNLSLALFAQPFIATGRYYDFMEFTQPRNWAKSHYGKEMGTIAPTTDSTGMVTEYTVDPDAGGPAASFTFSNPDFSSLSLRGNLVLRWEYRPASTIFLVWTHNQSGSGTAGDFQFSRDFSSMLGAPSTDVFLVKVSYRLGR